jgi:hypothetical protein
MSLPELKDGQISALTPLYPGSFLFIMHNEEILIAKGEQSTFATYVSTN